MSKVLPFLAKRWKAFMPLVAYGLSEAIKHGADVETPSGFKAALMAVLAALLVHQVPNKPATTTPAKPGDDVGAVGISLILRVLAFVCFVVFMFVGFDWVSADHPFGWLGAGLAFWLLSTFTD